MTDEPLYKIQELVTTGWEDILAEDDSVHSYNKEKCDERLRMYVDSGIAPNRLRAIRVA
tara:strand:- start:356 stop:532 length:177 start_codon:yes stop_codon:yes gene_type:complete